MYGWRIQSLLFRWYRELLALERELSIHMASGNIVT